jgi:hypothetical protein
VISPVLTCALSADARSDAARFGAILSLVVLGFANALYCVIHFGLRSDNLMRCAQLV